MKAQKSPGKALNRDIQEKIIERHDHLIRLRKRARKKLKPRTVHELRVSTRQLVAVLDLLKPLEAPVTLGKTRRLLKQLLRSLGDLRDAQVEHKRVCEDSRVIPLPRSIREETQHRQTSASRRAIKGLESYRKNRVAREIRALSRYLERSGAVSSNFERDLRILGKRHVQWRLEQVLEALAHLPKQAPSAASIHEVRIRFKHFRYSWELLETFFLPATKDRIECEKPLKQFQSLLGEIQDLHVLLATLAEIDGKGAGARQKYAQALTLSQEEKISHFIRDGESLLEPFRTYFNPRPKKAPSSCLRANARGASGRCSRSKYP